MSIYSVNYSQIEQELESAIGWLKDLGVNPNKGRFGLYHKALKIVFSNFNKKQDSNDNEFPIFVNAIYEVFDLIEIHKGVSNYDSEKLVSLANFYQKGVKCYSEENTNKSGNKSRNTAFELIVSSKFQKSEMKIDLSSSTDVAADFKNNRVLIECKRLQTENKIEANINDAKNQLKKKILNPERPRTCGIIALDFTKLLNPDFHLLVKPDEAGVLSSLDNATNKFIKANQKYWLNGLGRNVIGVLAYFSIMSVVENRNLLTHCKQYAFCPIPTISPRWQGVTWELAQKLGSTSKEVLIS